MVVLFFLGGHFVPSPKNGRKRGSKPFKDIGGCVIIYFFRTTFKKDIVPNLLFQKKLPESSPKLPFVSQKKKLPKSAATTFLKSIGIFFCFEHQRIATWTLNSWVFKKVKSRYSDEKPLDDSEGFFSTEKLEFLGRCILVRNKMVVFNEIAVICACCEPCQNFQSKMYMLCSNMNYKSWMLLILYNFPAIY